MIMMRFAVWNALFCFFAFSFAPCLQAEAKAETANSKFDLATMEIEMSTADIFIHMDGPRWNPRNEFLAFYGPKKGAQARVENIYPSPSGDALLLAISQVYTGDLDDLWLLDLSSGTYKNITSTSPVRSTNTPRVYRDNELFWRADGNPRWECILHRKCDRTEKGREWGQYVSADGNFVYNMDGSGAGLRLSRASTNERLLTIGDEPTPGGSIGYPRFSPQGRYHFIPQFMGHGTARYFLVDTKTQRFELLSIGDSIFPGYGNSVSVPVDSTERFLAVQTEIGDAMAIIDLNNKTARSLRAPEGLAIIDLAWSPDRTGKAFIKVYDSKTKEIFLTKTVERIE